MDVELLDKLVKGEYLLFALRRPAQQSDIVYNSLFEIALLHQILIRSVAVSLGKLMLLVLHNMLNVDINRDLPAESLVEKIILRRGSKILVSSYNVSDTHKMVVHNVCKVVCRHTVCLYENLVIKSCAVNRNVTVKLVMEGYLSLKRYFLSDYIRDSCIKLFLYLFGRKIAAMSVVHRSNSACLLDSPYLFKSLLIAETVVRLAFFHKFLSVFLEHTHSLRLNIRTYRTSDVRTLVPVKSDVLQSLINDLGRALNITLLIGILDSENKITAVFLCNKISEQRRSQISDVHIARRAWRKSRSDFVHFNLSFHFNYRIYKNLPWHHSRLISVLSAFQSCQIFFPDAQNDQAIFPPFCRKDHRQSPQYTFPQEEYHRC